MRRRFILRFLSAQRLCSVGLLLCGFNIGVTAAATDFSGSLTDPQGQLVPNATVRLWRRADSTRHEGRTDAQGQFSFQGLDGGEYRLTAESPGFAVLTQTIVVQAGGQQARNLQFSSVASRNESVTVTAAISDVGVLSQTRHNAL